MIFEYTSRSSRFNNQSVYVNLDQMSVFILNPSTADDRPTPEGTRLIWAFSLSNDIWEMEMDETDYQRFIRMMPKKERIT